MNTLNRSITVMAFVVMMLSASVLSVQAAEPVQVVQVDGNPTCEGMAEPYGFDFLFEYKLDPVEDVDVPLAFADVTGALTVDETDLQEFNFEFSENFAAVAVYAKAGNEGNLYLYGPKGQTVDVGLHGPVAPNGETHFDLSHITFCIVTTPAQNGSNSDDTQTPSADEVSSNPDGTPSAPETANPGADVPSSEDETPAPSDEPQSDDQTPSDSEGSQPADETTPQGNGSQTSDDTSSGSDGSSSGSETPQSDEGVPSNLGPSQEGTGPIFLPVVHG